MGTLYENILFLCELNKIAPGKMCGTTGISRGLISDLKMGRKSTVTVDTAQKIADYFGVSVDEVLGNKKAPPATNDGERLNLDYYNLSPANREMVDRMIEQLLKAQSAD